VSTRHLIETAVVAAAAVVVSQIVCRVLTRRTSDEYGRHFVRRAVRGITVVVTLVVLGFVWDVFSRRAGWAFALVAAGLAFALQEVLGAVAGWFNILLGGIYRIGDRIEMAGVHGDVIDITPLRTKILETGVSTSTVGGSEASSDQWVRGRQATGRIVFVSNKATFDSPVFNYSSMFEYVWHEVTFPISYDDDWQRAEEIIRDAAIEISETEQAQHAIDEMRRRYPIAISDLEPRVFAHATDNYMELSARFIVAVRTSRLATDELTRRVREGLQAAGIAFASTTMEVSVTSDGDRTSRESSRTG
jgi:small-conductance mechanosensitive channel